MPNTSSQRKHVHLLALGCAIRRARAKAGLSQDALASKSEVDRSYIGRIERGENNAAFLTLMKLADALDVTLGDLLKDAALC